MAKNNRNTPNENSRNEQTGDQDEMIGRVQDRMTQTPPKKISWKTYILLFLALAAVYLIITLVF